jgi:hypothetical protein
MMSLALEPRAFGPRAVDHTPDGAAATRGGDARRESGRGFLGAVAAELVAVPAMLLGAIALYVALSPRRCRHCCPSP